MVLCCVGSKQRAHDIKGHSARVRDIFDHHNARVLLIKEFSDDCDNDFIDYCESHVKMVLEELGEPIIDGQQENVRRQRQADGIAIAKQKGVYKGRKPLEIDEVGFEEQYRIWKSGNCTARTAMAKLGLKPNTFYRRVKEYESR